MTIPLDGAQSYLHTVFEGKVRLACSGGPGVTIQMKGKQSNNVTYNEQQLPPTLTGIFLNTSSGTLGLNS